jgi:type I site-specific restriction endonuclease
MTTKEKVTTPSVERRLGQIGRSVDELIQKWHTSDAASELRDDVKKELKRIDEQIAATRAQVGQDLATTRQDLAEAFREELDVWKARLEELDVQATLARMDLRDRVAPILRRVDAKLSHIRKDVEDLAEGEIVDEEGLSLSIQESMAGLRAEIEEVDEMC